MIHFRDLNPEEEKEFRQWARANYEPGMENHALYHPMIRDECNKIKTERL